MRRRVPVVIGGVKGGEVRGICGLSLDMQV
jgi:hypothetical protein